MKRVPGSDQRKMTNEEIRDLCEMLVGWLMVMREESPYGVISQTNFVQLTVQCLGKMDKGDLEMAVVTIALLCEASFNYMTMDDEAEVLLSDEEVTPRKAYSAMLISKRLTQALLAEGGEDDEDLGS